ncbi:MAG TPA: flagellar motor switch protein FliN [Clostridia bacterium]|nr:flagellar motor switch protein FliN [Clostridia bacterium]
MDIAAKEASTGLSPMEIDAIGEVLNISMGSAATAVSTMLDRQVTITTPRVSVESLGLVEYSALEPALSVKITYTNGLSGSNVLIFRQRDMQLILNQLMGIDDPPSDDFILDELSMSAACEVMNQMMGASATALAEFLGTAVNISTPEARIITPDYTFSDAIAMDANQQIVSIHFNMDIQGVMTSEFVSAMPIDLAKSMVGGFLGSTAIETEGPAPQQPEPMAPQPVAQPAAVQPAPIAPPPVSAAVTLPQAPVPTPAPAIPPQPQQTPTMAGAPGYPPYYPYPPYPSPVASGAYPPYPPYPPNGASGYPPYYPPYPPYPQPPEAPTPAHQMRKTDAPPPAKVQNVQLPQFGKSAPIGEPVLGGNTDLLMNVPLDVTIEIGQARRKIKDILAFAQGTVIELEKQAGAPVDIVVNGQLIAHGDVVVIDDNFGVRITEILGTRALLSSLEKDL